MIGVSDNPIFHTPLNYLQQTHYLTPYFKLFSANSTYTVQNSVIHARMHGVGGVGLSS
jgi:hypothetical protein